jgi:hypothetical protein
LTSFHKPFPPINGGKGENEKRKER